MFYGFKLNIGKITLGRQFYAYEVSLGPRESERQRIEIYLS